MILKLKNPSIAKYYDNYLSSKGLSSSILPEAVEWHFASSWGHLLNKYKRYKNNDLNKIFAETNDKLKSSLGIFISLKLDDQSIDNIFNIFNQAYKHYKKD